MRNIVPACIYRAVNKLIVKVWFSLLLIHPDRLVEMRIFSTIDPRSGFRRVQVEEKSQEYITCFPGPSNSSVSHSLHLLCPSFEIFWFPNSFSKVHQYYFGILAASGTALPNRAIFPAKRRASIGLTEDSALKLLSFPRLVEFLAVYKTSSATMPPLIHVQFRILLRLLNNL